MTDQESTPAASPAPDDKLAQVEQHVDRLASEMAAQIDGLTKSTRTTLWTGFVLVIVVVVYLKLIFNQVEELATPSSLAEVAEGQALQMIPQLSKNLETALRRAAPEVAREAGKTTIEALPHIREGILQHMEAAADKAVEKLDSNLDPLVDSMLRENHDEIKAFLPDLENKQRAVELGRRMKIELEKKFAAEVDTDLDKLTKTLDAINKKLEYLLTHDKLTPEEEFEKDLITTWAIFLSESLHESLSPGAKKPAAKSGAKKK